MTMKDLQMYKDLKMQDLKKTFWNAMQCAEWKTIVKLRQNRGV